MAILTLKPNSTWFAPNVSTVTKGVITAINIVDSYTPTESVVDSWDASVDNDGSVMVYVEGTVLTIAGNGSGKIFTNGNASYMFAEFYYVTAINGLNILDTSKSVNMNHIFYRDMNLTHLDVSGWDTRNAENMEYLFGAYKTAYSMKLQEIKLGDNFDTSKVTSFFGMFENCKELITVDTSNWNTSNVINTSWMFSECNKLQSVDVSKWDVGKVENLEAMFNRCYVLSTIDVSNWNVSSCKNFHQLFNQCSALESLDVSKWDLSSAENMRTMFQQCGKLQKIDVSKWNTSNITNMGYMFYGCSSMKSIDFEDWDVSNVTDFNHFLAHAWMEEFDVSKWKVTSKCTIMQGMFHTALVKSIDVRGFDTSNVVDMCQMFENTEHLEEIIGIEDWDTSKCTTFQEMFNNAYAIRKLDLSKWDTRQMIYVANMFNRVTLDEFSIGGNYVFTGDQNYQSHFFPNSTTGYWYSLYGEQYVPDEAPRGKAMSYYSTVESAKAALIELNGKKYVSLNSLSMFHDLQNVEIDTKINTLREELGNIEEISSEEIQALFGVNV